MSIPPVDANTLLYDIVTVVTFTEPTQGAPRGRADSVEGTGFLLGGHTLVTCHHCVRAGPDPPRKYAIARLSPLPRLGIIVHLLEDIRQLSAGVDIAIAGTSVGNSLGFTVSETPLLAGQDVWTFGYPLTDVELGASGDRFFTTHPRLLKGHILRSFVFQNGDGHRIPSYELSFPVPAGMSGAPLFKVGGYEVCGILYGNNDVARVEAMAVVNQETGYREVQVEHVVSFGLAHHTTTTALLRDFEAGSARDRCR